jgi:hypothetical protein
LTKGREMTVPMTDFEGDRTARSGFGEHPVVVLFPSPAGP